MPNFVINIRRDNIVDVVHAVQDLEKMGYICVYPITKEIEFHKNYNLRIAPKKFDCNYRGTDTNEYYHTRMKRVV